MQILLPVSFANVPGGQGRHADALNPVKYCAIGHSEHVELPGRSWKLPGGHAWHVLLAFPAAKYPSGHGVQPPALTPEYSPRPHAKQTVACCDEKYPAWQARQLLFTSYVPAWHGKQSCNEPAPEIQLAVPRGHGLQSVIDPAYIRSKYVCSGQSRQAVRPSPAYLPSWHVAHWLAPTAPEKVPFVQFAHAVAPVAEKYLPTWQNSQSSSSLYLPAMQAVQAYTVCAPTYGDAFPTGHCLQLVTDPWYGTSRYVSAGHAVQTLLPTGA